MTPLPRASRERQVSARAVWTVRKIADYWRLQRDGYLVATYRTKGAALAGMMVEKRRHAAKAKAAP